MKSLPDPRCFQPRHKLLAVFGQRHVRIEAGPLKVLQAHERLGTMKECILHHIRRGSGRDYLIRACPGELQL